jgi:hypothetical protein
MATKTKVASNTVFSVLGDTLESAAETFEEATANSRDSARRAAATTKRALGIGVHKAAYGVAYGLVYSAVFITEMLPKDNLIRRGFLEGTEAAIESRRKAHVAREAKRAATHVGSNHTTAKKPKASAKARKAVNKRAAQFDADAATE